MADFGDRLHGAFSRGGSRPGTAREAAQSMRDAGLSTREIAERSGTSQRTIQRYLSGQSAGHSRAGAGLVDAARSAPEVRAASVSPGRAARMRNHGARIRMSGTLGPVVGGKDYRRPGRDLDWNMSGEAMDRAYEAWLAGDDDEAREIFREELELEYGVTGWDWDDDELERFDFQRH